MAHTAYKKDDFEWSAPQLFMAFLAGVAAVGAIWLFTGLMIGLLFI